MTGAAGRSASICARTASFVMRPSIVSASSSLSCSTYVSDSAMYKEAESGICVMALTSVYSAFV